ncbi:MAG: cytochrome c biogenesis protein ResB [Pyrinomonadaceae bacterium]|nr:cytochrome c biogenesis protein ResB [Pyrinomonadaceae bacterium]
MSSEAQLSSADDSIVSSPFDGERVKSAPLLNRLIDFVSSVRFGVVLLCILVILSIIGMLVIQQNVEGFEAFYASLTPAERIVGSYLGVFDIYHSFYYNGLLLILSLNIILASIDHFPNAWKYISKPKLDASRKWLLGQKENAVIEAPDSSTADIPNRIAEIFKKNGLRAAISEKKGKTFVFGESGRWNRLGAYIVHVFLLILFLGHFVALQTGFDADVQFVPGETTNQIEMIAFKLDQKEKFAVGLPFSITSTDIQQKLIDPKGSIEINNTMDWSTSLTIDDPEYGKTDAVVSLNNPFQYRGYRFFQASAITYGSARNMTLELTPQGGGEPITLGLARNGETTLPDGTKVAYDEFFPDFVLNNGKADSRSGEYNNPVVKLNLSKPDGEKSVAYAFAMKLPDSAPVGAPVAGYRWRLAEFEKSPFAHVLSIKYDPYNAAFIAWYVGGIGLMGALVFVFFVSHRRVWALVEENGEIVVGGITNRNHQGFKDKFAKLISDLRKI